MILVYRHLDPHWFYEVRALCLESPCVFLGRGGDWKAYEDTYVHGQ